MDVSGIPNMGFGGGGYFAGNPGYASQPQYLAQHNANLNYVSSQQPSQAQLYGGGSFGAQPAYYAGLGAAYGRATGGFKPAPQAAQQPSAMPAWFGGAQRNATPVPSTYGAFNRAYPSSTPVPSIYGAFNNMYGTSRATDLSSQSRAPTGWGGVSPPTNYGSFQARAPYTQWFGATGNDPNVANSIYALAGRTGYNPAAHAGVAQMESRFNPAQRTGSHYGIYQLSGSGSQNMWGDSPFRGTMGGLTFPQYKAASAPAQINSYGDWLTRGNVNTLNRGYNFPSASVPTQAAALQAMQFAGNSPGWRTAYGQGNMNVPVTPKPQASELGGGTVHGPTMNQMSNAYSNMFSRWGR